RHGDSGRQRHRVYGRDHDAEGDGGTSGVVNAVSPAAQSSVVGSPGVWNSFPLPSLMLKKAQVFRPKPVQQLWHVISATCKSLVRQNIRLWYGTGLPAGKLLFPRCSSDFSWR